MEDAGKGARRRGAVSPHHGVRGVPRLVPCPSWGSANRHRGADWGYLGGRG